MIYYFRSKQTISTSSIKSFSKDQKKLNSQKKLITKYKNRYFHLKNVRNRKCKLNLLHQLPKVPGLSKTALTFISCQIEMAQLQNRARRYSEQMKSLSLDIYFHSNKCFRMLSKLFKLPTIPFTSELAKKCGYLSWIFTNNPAAYFIKDRMF